MTGLCRRLAERHAQAGLAHPMAAAVAQAGRGRHGLTIEQYAELLDVPLAELRQVEAGEIPLPNLPAPLVADLLASGRIHLQRLCREDRRREI